MPGILDRIETQKAILAGMYKAAQHEAAEIEKHGLLADCADLDHDLRAAYVTFRDVLHKIVDEMSDRITKKAVGNGRNGKRNNK